MNESKTYASVAVALVVLSGIFFVVERIVGRGRNRRQPVFRRGWLTDVVYLFMTALVTKPFVRLMIIVPVLLLGFAPIVTLSAGPVLTFYAIFIQANVNWEFGSLRYVIATPVFHRWHHSREREAWDKDSAGLLPLWDMLFGTFYMPRDRYAENFGICEPMLAAFAARTANEKTRRETSPSNPWRTSHAGPFQTVPHGRPDRVCDAARRRAGGRRGDLRAGPRARPRRRVLHDHDRWAPA